MTLLISLMLASCSSQPKLNKEQTNLGYLLDAEGNIVLALNTDVYMTTVRSDYRQRTTQEAQDIIFFYHRLLDCYHDYLDDSGNQIVNVKYLNEHIDCGPVKVQEELIEAIKLSIEMAKLTKGYFNPTIGKLVDAYEGKFTPFETTNTDPDKNVIDEALASIVPYEMINECITIDEEASTISLKSSNGTPFKINLGAISKGFVLDKIDLEIDTSFLLSAGSSSIRGYNAPNEDISWTIASKLPDSSDIMMAYGLNNTSVSTSGDDEQYYLLDDGTRRHHILNPFTGYSENTYRRVTLVSECSGVVDALSTAVFNASKPDMAKELIEDVEKGLNIDIDYCLLCYEDGKYVSYMDDGFNDRLIAEYNSPDVERIVME